MRGNQEKNANHETKLNDEMANFMSKIEK